MSMKLSSEEVKVASNILHRIDNLARSVQVNFAQWGMSKAAARELVQQIDKVADTMEVSFFGKDSLQRRQVEVLKQAKVIQQDSDESYMSTFNSPQAVHQQDSDEPYMKAYNDDQSMAVNSGKSSTGRALAP